MLPSDTALTSPVSFAHLAGVRPPQTALGGVVPVPPLVAREKDADDDADMRRAQDEEDAKKAKKARRAKKAKQRDDDDGGDDDPDDCEDDDDEDMKVSSVTGRARRRERARCAAIFGCAAATGNAPLAAHFAFNTTLTRAQAIGALEAAVATMGRRTGGLDQRMQAAGVPNVAAGGAPAASAAERILASAAKARGGRA